MVCECGLFLSDGESGQEIMPLSQPLPLPSCSAYIACRRECVQQFNEWRGELTHMLPGEVAMGQLLCTHLAARGRPHLAPNLLKMAAAGTEAMNPPAKKYGSVVITLENVLLPPEKLSPSPSQQDGLDQEIEMDLRILGCELIQTGGILLRLPQVAMAAGQVLFQRFYYAKSMVRYPMETTAMACIALASKIEEAPRKIRDVINVFNHIRQVKNGKTIQPVILDSNYIALKNQVIKAERRLLKELGFCCHVKHPHKIIIMYLRLLEADDNRWLAMSS